jgi:hypothetical protein
MLASNSSAASLTYIARSPSKRFPTDSGVGDANGTDPEFLPSVKTQAMAPKSSPGSLPGTCSPVKGVPKSDFFDFFALAPKIASQRFHPGRPTAIRISFNFHISLIKRDLTLAEANLVAGLTIGWASGFKAEFGEARRQPT